LIEQCLHRLAAQKVAQRFVSSHQLAEQVMCTQQMHTGGQIYPLSAGHGLNASIDELQAIARLPMMTRDARPARAAPFAQSPRDEALALQQGLIEHDGVGRRPIAQQALVDPRHRPVPMLLQCCWHQGVEFMGNAQHFRAQVQAPLVDAGMTVFIGLQRFVIEGQQFDSWIIVQKQRVADPLHIAVASIVEQGLTADRGADEKGRLVSRSQGQLRGSQQRQVAVASGTAAESVDDSIAAQTLRPSGGRHQPLDQWLNRHAPGGRKGPQQT